ncbi:MAG: hypothetical protein IKZ51_02385 [Bacteroidales bacterium]|nr:hypothetical protein [Bacteroidales bacterium]
MNGKCIIYQLLPRLWGKGKFSSCDAELLAYLKSMEVGYLWLTGIPRHSSGKPFVKGDPGSPYAVCDWYDVNPYLADEPGKRMQEFEALVGRIHSAGLRCLVDFIPNHVGCDYEGGLAVHNYCDGDWTDTRKVDWSDPRTEAEYLKVLRFWASKGVDGFRCDMVELVPADALGRVIKAVKREFPGMLFVAEVYRQDNYTRYLVEGGFDLLYDKTGSYDILRGILAGSHSARELSWNWQWLGSRQSSMLNFLENHDEQRIPSPWFAGDANAVWGALAFDLLFNDASFMLYAGQEVGEDAAEGHEGRTSIFEWCKPEGLGCLYDYVHSGTELLAVRKELLTRYRELLALSRRPVFLNGSNWDLCYCCGAASGFNPDKHFVFMRYDDESAWLVLCNFSAETAMVSVYIPEELRLAANIYQTESLVSAPPRGYALLKCK